METVCGANCNVCDFKRSNKCKGCTESKSRPFGKECFVAKYITTGGRENYNEFKQQLIDEFNLLNIPGMPKINELYELNGSFVNIEYPMPNGDKVKLLDDNNIYLGNQVECEFSDEQLVRCYGLVAGVNFLLVSEYGVDGDSPELVIYKRR